MANFTQNTLSFYHTFSKTQVNKNAPFNSLGNSINKSGHTVQASDVWADDIPFFAEKGTTGEVHSIFSAHAQTNDLVKVGSKFYQRNSTPYTSGATFETLWSEKTKSIADWSIVDGKYQYTEVDGALVDGSYLVNAAGKPVIKYHERAQLSILTAANNANVTSNKLASRLKVGGTWGTDAKENVPFMNGGQWVEQFITVTDKYVNGEAATIYAPKVYATKTTEAPYEAGSIYFDFCATGVILWDGKTANGQEVITCFEYVGDKLSTALGNISSEIEDIVSTTMEGVVASVGTTNAASTAGLSIKGTKTAPTVDITTGTVTAGEAKLVTGGAVATVTDALAGRIAQLEGIQHFSVAVVDTLPTTLVENTIYLVPEDGSTTGTYVEYIAYKPEGSDETTTERIGTTAIDLEGYTTDAEHQTLQGRVSTIEDTTVPALEQSIAGAKTEAATNLASARTEITAEIAQAKSEAIAGAEVTINQGTGIVVTGAGKGTTFTISVSDEVATAASVSALSQVVASNKTEIDGKIASASTALETAKTEIKGTTDALAGRLQTAEGKVSTLEGQVATLTSGDNSVAKQIETAATAIKGQSLAQTGTLSGMFTVQTEGSVGTGITAIKISDTGLATAIAAAKSGAEQTAATNLATARGQITSEIGTAVSGLQTKLTTGEGSLGAKVTALETATGTTLPAAITKAQGDAEAAAKKYTDDEIDKVEKSISDALNTHSEDIAKVEAAISSLSTSGFERVVVSELPTTGIKLNAIYLVPMTTAEKELNGYAEYIYVGGTVTEGVVSGGKFEQIGTTKTDLAEYAKTSEVEAAVKAVQDDVDALEKTHADDKTALEESIATKVGDVQWFGENDLISSKAEIVDGKLVVTEQEVTVPDLSGVGITKVINNEAYIGDTKYATIEFDKLKTQDATFYQSSLSEFVSPLPLLKDGSHMFGAKNLKEFIGDLVSLTEGGHMFAGAGITKFIGDLSSLSRAYSMFGHCNELTTFISDLSSLTTASRMFENTNLSLESVECIADTINESEGVITISWNTLPAEDKRQELVDELSRIVDKGWTLSTNQQLLPLFDSEKYETGETKVQPLDLDSEPQTIYYVVKK